MFDLVGEKEQFSNFIHVFKLIIHVATRLLLEKQAWKGVTTASMLTSRESERVHNHAGFFKGVTTAFTCK
uniref:Uncharacterized protein n=1 Tax=Rhizophora mucronata TaxID=61149 RepID=A0A2P2N7X3_RHIMU